MNQRAEIRRDGGGPKPGTLQSGDPHRLGAYVLLGRLGEGGMGTVFLARDEQGLLVAVKVIRAIHSRDERFRARFRREVAAARRVARFCTAPVLDADVEAEDPYVVTEFIDGPDLQRVVTDDGPLATSTLEGLAVGVATALAAIHTAGVVHRDLKPGNVLLSRSGPRVIDFGIAGALDFTQGLTDGRHGLGSPAFMAPEQLEGEGPVTAAADVFAWGCVVAYAGTGRRPFTADNPVRQAFRVVYEDPDLEGLDAGLRPVVELALHKDPADRPTAQALLTLLLGGAPQPADSVEVADELVRRTWPDSSPPPDQIPPPDPIPPPHPPARTRGRPRGAVILTVLLLLATLAAIATLAALDRRTDTSATQDSAPPAPPSPTLTDPPAPSAPPPTSAAPAPEVVALEAPVFDVEALAPGSVEAQASWTDVRGDNLLVLSRDTDLVSADPADGLARVLLSAQHHRGAEGQPELLAERETSTDSCDGDIVDRFYPETVAVTDLDGDGIGEASVVRATGCVTDVAAGITALLFTDGAVHEVSGVRSLVGGAGDATPGDVDGTTPEVFAEHLRTRWAGDLSPASGTASPSGAEGPAALVLTVGDVEGATTANLVETDGDELDCVEPVTGPLARGGAFELPGGPGFAAGAAAILQDEAAADGAVRRLDTAETVACYKEQVRAGLLGRTVVSTLDTGPLDLTPQAGVETRGTAIVWTGSSQGADTGGVVEILVLRVGQRVGLVRYSYLEGSAEQAARWRAELLSRAADRLRAG